MTFDDVLATRTPGAMPVPAYAARARAALARIGFAPGRALLCLVTCPDELCDPLRQELRRGWGMVFDGAALAGVPVLGRDGFGAAAGHAPVHDGRRRLACVVLAHVAVGADGALGPCRRPGLPGPSGACGALVRLRDLLGAGAPPAHDPDNAGLGALWAALQAGVEPGGAPDLWALTRLALAAGPALAERHLAAAAAADPSLDYAVLGGLQVHGPAGRDYVWPASASAVVGGRRREGLERL